MICKEIVQLGKFSRTFTPFPEQLLYGWMQTNFQDLIFSEESKNKGLYDMKGDPPMLSDDMTTISDQ